MRFVNQPALTQIKYNPSVVGFCPSLESLSVVVGSLDIRQDPYVKSLLGKPDKQDEILKLLDTKKTKSRKSLNQFLGKAVHVWQELGPFAAEYFISTAIDRLASVVAHQHELFIGWLDSERTYVLQVLSQVKTTSLEWPLDLDSNHLSPKVLDLINYLQKLPNDYHGIIFVEQRVVAALLSKILSVHSATKDVGCGSFVGASNNAQRRPTLGELADFVVQQEILVDFRNRRARLIVATNALDEGIDVASCNLVVCFAKPQNLRSFIQKRGRARDSKSSFVIMLAEDDYKGRKDWSGLERDMIQAYESERKEAEEEALKESMEEDDPTQLKIPSTG
jgi:hypothetical protein